MPTVTEILSPFVDYSHVPPDRLEMAAERGSLVHAAIKSHLLGLYCPPLRNDSQGYFDSFRRWADKMIDTVIFVEKELADFEFGFIGHPDFLGILKGDNGFASLEDWKTPLVESKTWEAQVAGGYWHLVGKAYSNVKRCGAIMLDPKGKIAKMKENI